MPTTRRCRAPSRRAPARRRRRRRGWRKRRDGRTPPTGSARISRPTAPRWSRASAPSSKTYFPTMAAKKQRRSKRRRRPIPNGRASAPAAPRTASYNLESFVSAEITLADHLAEQMALAISDPAGRMIGHYLVDMVDETGYLIGDLDTVADKLGARRSDVEAVLAVLQTFDPPGVCARNLTECLALQLKERDRYDPAMRALVEHLDLLGQARSRRLAPPVRRRRRRSRRHDRRDPQSQSQAGTGLRLDAGAADRARCLCARGAGRHLAGRTQFRHAAESADQPALLCASVEDRAQRQRQDLSRRLSADRDLAGARARPAREDHSQSVERNRAPAGRILHQRRAASAAAQSQDRRRRHRHARVRPCRASLPTNTWRPAAASSN